MAARLCIRDVGRAMNYLYNNSKIYLDRKYDKYNILKNMK